MLSQKLREKEKGREGGRKGRIGKERKRKKQGKKAVGENCIYEVF